MIDDSNKAKNKIIEADLNDILFAAKGRFEVLKTFLKGMFLEVLQIQ